MVDDGAVFCWSWVLSSCKATECLSKAQEGPYELLHQYSNTMDRAATRAKRIQGSIGDQTVKQQHSVKHEVEMAISNMVCSLSRHAPGWTNKHLNFDSPTPDFEPR